MAAVPRPAAIKGRRLDRASAERFRAWWGITAIYIAISAAFVPVSVTIFAMAENPPRARFGAGNKLPAGLFDTRGEFARGLPIELIAAWTASDQTPEAAQRLLDP